MKNLIVMRHAKSSWAMENLSDFDRPLNERGERNAPEMARRLKHQGVTIDLIVHSPALRTTQTAEHLQTVLEMLPQLLIPFDELYLAEPEILLATAKSLPEEHDTVLLLAHNPGVTQFVNLACDVDIDNIVTAGIAQIQFDCEHWKDVEFHQGTLIDYDYPKSNQNN